MYKNSVCGIFIILQFVAKYLTKRNIEQEWHMFCRDFHNAEFLLSQVCNAMRFHPAHMANGIRYLQCGTICCWL